MGLSSESWPKPNIQLRRSCGRRFTKLNFCWPLLLDEWKVTHIRTIMSTLLNWQKKRTWSDKENAIFLVSRYGNGASMEKRILKKLPLLKVDKSRLMQRIYAMKTDAYKHPLQTWEGSYVLNVQFPVPTDRSNMDELMTEVIKWFHNVVASDVSGLSTNVITQDVSVHRKIQKIPAGIASSFTNLKLLDCMHNAATNFIAMNRPNELKLFLKCYPTNVPRDCFVSIYDSGCESGILKHSDHVSFCTVVFCLQGSIDESKDLILTLENNEELSV